MTNPFSSLVFRNRFFGIIFLIVLALIAWGLFFKKPIGSRYETFKVQRADIIQEVYVSGRIKTPEVFNLGFERAGKIIKVSSKIGDQIFPGKILIELDSSEFYAQLNQEQANLEVQEAKLNELKSGARPEEIAISQTKVSSAQISLLEAQKNLNDELQKSYITADDVIKSKVDGMFINANGSNPQLQPSLNDAQLKYSVETQRKNIGVILSSWRGQLHSAEQSKENLLIIRQFLDDMALVANNLNAGAFLTQAIIDGYKNNISLARSSINSAISSLNSAQEKLHNSQSALELAQKELELKKAGATKEQIQAQEALIKQAKAKISLIQTQINKNILRSPIYGTISKQEARVGEIAGVNEILISILPKESLVIESNIPEIDIGKISLKQPVKISIDAYPGETFEGIVSYIEPAETIIDGVVNYKTTVSLKTADPRLKSGLTANLSIETLRKIGVIAIPRYAFIEKEGGAYVKKLVNGVPIEEKIQIGIKGQDGFTEVISGLNEGDEILSIGLKNNISY